MTTTEEIQNILNGTFLENDDNSVVDERFMKPFELGWRREVVIRLIPRSNYCDIYYFHPNGKKLRSMAEVKANLTDGLTPDCFTFKKKLLNVKSEIVRKAMDRGHKSRAKAMKSLTDNNKTSRVTKLKRPENAPYVTGKSRRQVKKEQQSNALEVKKLGRPRKVPGTKLARNKGIDAIASDFILFKKMLEASSKILKTAVSQYQLTERKKPSTASSKRQKLAKLEKPEKPNYLKGRTRRQMMKRKKEQQSSILEAKKLIKSRTAPERKRRKKATQKAAKSKQEEPLVEKSVSENENAVASDKQCTEEQFQIPGTGSVPVKVKSDGVSAEQNCEYDDIKSIVQRNIGKYREMRKKQINQGLRESPRVNLTYNQVGRSKRSEPISKKMHMYLKPLERGWRRELVYRVNGPDAAGRSDVYYFHPNGKKLRSSREIANYLTHGLTMECFTFRKEALGCGEPQEIIRNARLNKNQNSKD